MPTFPVDVIRRLTEEQIAFVRRCGLKAEVLERGHVTLRMPLAGNENHVGSMYAGALFTLAELPGGVLALTSFDSQRFYPIVKEASLRYRRPAASDVRVSARLDEDEQQRIAAEAARDSKAEYTLALQLCDLQGEVVAESRAVYQLRSR